MSKGLLVVVFCLSGCAAMHHVTGDAMFAPEVKDTRVRGPVVPEPEPSEPTFEAELQEAKKGGADDDLPPLPQPKKKSSKVVASSAAKK